MASNAGKDATAESSPPCLRQSTKPSLLTIAAIAIVATVIANFIHEGLGHGGMCIATGGQPLVLSTVHFQCSADTRLVAAGGTLVNLAFGGLFWVATRAVKQTASWRYFFWLLMTFNLFHAGGYFLFSGAAFRNVPRQRFREQRDHSFRLIDPFVFTPTSLLVSFQSVCYLW